MLPVQQQNTASTATNPDFDILIEGASPSLRSASLVAIGQRFARVPDQSSRPLAPASALLRVRNVLDGLLGTEVHLQWEDVEYALKCTGRVALTSADRERLGDLALKIPPRVT